MFASFLTEIEFTDVLLNIFFVFMSGFVASATVAGLRDFSKSVINRY
jgi:hypothetical protein